MPPGLHDLRTKAFMLHRDISFSNIMCDMSGGNPKFILNDFDLAVQLDEDGEPAGASSNHRTGTLPFISVELLHDFILLMESQKVKPKNATQTEHLPITHRLRHDFESLFWTILWGALVSSKHQSTKQRKAVLSEISSWETGELATIASHKSVLYTDDAIFDKLPLSSPFNSYPIYSWILRFRDVMASPADSLKAKRKKMVGQEARAQTRLSEAELDSLINKETIIKALKDVSMG